MEKTNQLLRDIDKHMRAEWYAGRLSAESWPKSLSDRLAASLLATGGQGQAVEKLREELAEETEAASNWRRLALQFDGHRMTALGHLKAILHPDSSVDEYKAAELFLKAPPLDGESVLAQRITELSTAPQQADARDAEGGQ